MGLETGTTIAQLVASNPTSDDKIEEGDNHTRLIKGVLKAQFPGSGGAGFATPIIAVEDEINRLTNVRDNVQAQLDALEARIIALENA